MAQILVRGIPDEEATYLGDCYCGTKTRFQANEIVYHYYDNDGGAERKVPMFDCPVCENSVQGTREPVPPPHGYYGSIAIMSGDLMSKVNRAMYVGTPMDEILAMINEVQLCA